MEGLVVYTDEYLDEKRTAGDPAADEFVLKYFSDIASKRELKHWMDALETNRQLDITNGRNAVPDNFCDSELIRSSLQLPSWANPAAMKKGSAFFGKYAEPIMNLLGLLSLPYCYAAADGAFVLQLSERMRNETGKRLFDTADFIWAVMAPQAFAKQGQGFSSILKVRITHAVARHYTLENKEWNPNLGLPLNQEDMAGTNLSMSLIVIRGLRKLGFIIQYEEQLAFMHLWNVIGSLLGIHRDLLPETGRQAQRLEAMIRKRQFKSSVHGQSLTKALTDFFSSRLTSNSVDQNEVLGLMRFLLGDEVTKILGLSAPELSRSKIQTLRALNFFNVLKGNNNHVSVYHEAFRRFRLQKAAAFS
jgi:hypothetical protein